MIRRIATVAIYVEDQDATERFWDQQVGFDVHRNMPMGPNARWMEVGPSSEEACLVIYPRSMMEDWAERKPSIVFECDDIHQTYEGMHARGVVFRQPPQATRWGAFAIFQDIDGYEYGLRASRF